MDEQRYAPLMKNPFEIYYVCLLTITKSEVFGESETDCARRQLALFRFQHSLHPGGSLYLA